jgi:hypothetical protein
MKGKELQHLEEIFTGKGKLFADVHGHGAVVDADAVKVHERKSRLRKGKRVSSVLFKVFSAMGRELR